MRKRRVTSLNRGGFGGLGGASGTLNLELGFDMKVVLDR